MQKKVIKKLEELFIIQTGKYLKQSKQGYITCIAGRPSSLGKTQKLNDWHMEQHLKGKFTVGTFSGEQTTKFMTFDVDFHDPIKAKWITGKIVITLNELNIEHHISFSGNKGYHIDIFFDDLIKVTDAKSFFNHVIQMSDVIEHSDDGNKVEFRVTNSQGVKLPLGIHQKTGKYCGFIDDDFNVMNRQQSEAYLLTIHKIESQQVLDILEIDDVDKQNIDTKELIEVEDAVSPFVPPKNHEQSEDYSIDLAKKLLNEGLNVQGSRHKATFLVCLYLKYSGLEADECRNELYTWMEWQNPDSYTTKLADCYKDIDQIVKDVCNDDKYNLSGGNKDLNVSLNEMKWIVERCPEKNQKLITYALLKHSKRHANLQGVFYMPFTTIAKSTGVTRETAINQVNKLINLGVIDVVARNRKPTGGKGFQRNLPNLYRLNIDVIVDDSSMLEVNESHDFKSCILYFFERKELKRILPRKQYESLVG
ncbi:TOTE conflict system archaeo-eukaryotic primase domain-containing protein [Cohnella soli]|uniref:TOTE conflict system primase domain-containing protein n=1 Tax=Cohnella soli TaxID=425005 RepID=A0ABW0HS11_9BACL